MEKTPTLKSLTGVIDPVQELTSKRDTAVQDELAAQQKVQALEVSKAASEAKRTSELEQSKVRSTEDLTKRQKEREEPIRAQKSEVDTALMNEHFAPSKENLQDQAALFSLINVIGFAIGAGGKQNAMQAMHAMNGMLEGHQQGRADVFKQEQVKFDKNFKALQQKAVFLENELRHSLEEFTRDKRAADERATAAFAAAGADFMKAYAEKNGYVAAYERAKEVRKSLDKAIEGERLRKERIEDKAKADLQHLQLVQAMKSSKTEKTEKPAARKETLPLIQGIRSVEKLMSDLNDPDIQTGMIAKAAPLLEKIKSLNPNEDFSTAVNNTLTGTDKTTVFLKNALLNSYAIERAASGGGRLTVAMMRQAGPVLDPTNYTPQAYRQILEDRRQEFYENLQDLGYTPEHIKEVASPRAYQPYGAAPAAAPAAAATPASKPMPTGEKIKAYADSYFNGNEESARQYLKTQGYQ
jgi:hypothetical protein